MNRRAFLLTLAASASGVAAAGSSFDLMGFRLPLTAKNTRKSLLIGGAGAMFGLNQALAAQFSETHPLVDVVVEKGGSLPGLIAVKRGAIDLAAMARELSVSEDEPGMRNFLIARSSVTIVVNKTLPIKNLAQQQIRGLLTGGIRNWKDVGGPDAPVNVVSRMRGSTTRQFIEEVVLDGEDIITGAKEMASTKLQAEAIAADPHAIGYVASKDDAGKADIAALSVDGVEASRATVLSDRYPYTHSFYLLLYGDRAGLARDFVVFARSAAGQKIVAQQGLLPVY